MAACEVAPTSLPCTNDCGSGTAACVDGVVGECAVPPTRVSCTNVCGAGSASCIDGIVGTCEVPDTTVACMDPCGAGTASCSGGVVGTCEGVVTERGCSSPCGPGIERCDVVTGTWGPCSAEVPLPPVLEARIRDFRRSHPDFEAAIGNDRGLVEPFLDGMGKPVYAPAGPTATVSGQASFDQWYRDVPGVNQGVDVDLPLTETPSGLFVFDDLTFFPIDGMLFGNEGFAHNFHFTLEATTVFRYLGGEIFRFRGDDDVFVFIDGQLVIDLGGVHGRQEATVDLDTVAPSLGLVMGERYTLHLFFAERHTSASTFTVETTLADTFRCGMP